MFKTTGIDHVAVNTNDMEATLQFYCGILGMRLARTSRTGDGRRHYNVEIGGGNAPIPEPLRPARGDRGRI